MDIILWYYIPEKLLFPIPNLSSSTYPLSLHSWDLWITVTITINPVFFQNVLENSVLRYSTICKISSGNLANLFLVYQMKLSVVQTIQHSRAIQHKIPFLALGNSNIKSPNQGCCQFLMVSQHGLKKSSILY